MTTATARRTARAAAFATLTLLLAGGCITVPEKDYSAFRANMPRSILVLPPLNETVDANASYSYLTVASEALGERGYYVFPVGVIDAFMRENGLPDPAEMHAVSLEKIDEIIGPDAVLYLTLEEFGQKFEILSSVTRVRVRASLVDVDTGQELWTGSASQEASSGSTGQGALADLLAAAISQIGSTVSDATHDAARLANDRLVSAPGQGLLYGPRHPLFGTKELPGTETAPVDRPEPATAPAAAAAPAAAPS